ncbi:permease, partial [Escherichia coli O51]|nr:permease [Escherichia coli O51]
MLITGIDLNGIRIKYHEKNIKTFNKNVIIHDDDNLKNDSQIFLSGIPFKILLYQGKEKTDFLNSLGVGGESR